MNLIGFVEELEKIRDSQTSQQFVSALSSLTNLAESGFGEAATYLAELLAFSGPHQSVEEAYKWFYVGLCQSGYTTTFLDQNGTPPYYCGPVGDFRFT